MHWVLTHLVAALPEIRHTNTEDEIPRLLAILGNQLRESDGDLDLGNALLERDVVFINVVDVDGVAVDVIECNACSCYPLLLAFDTLACLPPSSSSRAVTSRIPSL